jgi:hypothetical protein
VVANPPAGGGWCSAGAGYSGGCREGNCQSFVQLGKAIQGVPVDMAKLNSHAGSNDPLNMFQNGGSENIAVTARAAKYWVENDPTWFERYFDIQFSGQVGVFGSEIFSNTYMALTVGNLISVRAHAAKLRHWNLVCF